MCQVPGYQVCTSMALLYLVLHSCMLWFHRMCMSHDEMALHCLIHSCRKKNFECPSHAPECTDRAETSTNVSGRASCVRVPTVCRKVLVRREKLAKVRKIDKHTYTNKCSCRWYLVLYVQQLLIVPVYTKYYIPVWALLVLHYCMFWFHRMCTGMSHDEMALHCLLYRITM